MEQHQILPIGKVFESPLNPRKTYNEKKMEELIESVRAKGILMPLLVRPNDGRFEIAAGHRRYRAALKVKLADVPAIVRDMSDTDFLEILTIENLQREDLEPLDEAQGYRMLMEKASYDVPSIAAKIGKSESYIYQRLKLLELIPEAQERLAKNKITAGHAILIARLQAKQQKEALKACFEWGADGKSVRELTEWINRNIHLDLNSASFPKANTALVPEAGSCTTCQKRTGFVPQLFPDVAKKDTCTDPGCFHAKVKAFTDRWISEKSQDTDWPPLRLSGNYDYCAKIVEGKPISSNLYHEIHDKNDRCESIQEGIIVEGHGQGQVKQICIDPKCKKHHGRPEADAYTKRWKAEQAARKEKEHNEEALRLKILDSIMTKMSGDLSQKDLIFIALRESEDMMGDEGMICKRHRLEGVKRKYGGLDYSPALKKYIEDCSKAELCKLLMEISLIRVLTLPNWYSKKKEDPLLEMAERYKVDVKAIEKEMIAAIKEKKQARKKKEANEKKALKAKPQKVQTSAKKKAKVSSEHPAEDCNGCKFSRFSGQKGYKTAKPITGQDSIRCAWEEGPCK